MKEKTLLKLQANCKAKRPFDKRKEACQAAARDKNSKGFTRKTPYKCPICKFWHLTSRGGTVDLKKVGDL